MINFKQNIDIFLIDGESRVHDLRHCSKNVDSEAKILGHSDCSFDKKTAYV